MRCAAVKWSPNFCYAAEGPPPYTKCEIRSASRAGAASVSALWGSLAPRAARAGARGLRSPGVTLGSGILWRRDVHGELLVA